MSSSFTEKRSFTPSVNATLCLTLFLHIFFASTIYLLFASCFLHIFASFAPFEATHFCNVNSLYFDFLHLVSSSRHLSLNISVISISLYGWMQIFFFFFYGWNCLSNDRLLINYFC